MVPTLPMGLGEERKMEHEVLGLRTGAENHTDDVAIWLEGMVFLVSCPWGPMLWVDAAPSRAVSMVFGVGRLAGAPRPWLHGVVAVGARAGDHRHDGAREERLSPHSARRNRDSTLFGYPLGLFPFGDFSIRSCYARGYALNPPLPALS